MDVVAISDAVMDLQAIPVYDDSGEVVGHFGAGFIETDQLRQRREQARALIEEPTGQPYAG